MISAILTDREKECLYYMREGRTNKEIAALMKIETDTVRKHYASKIYKKLKIEGILKAGKRKGLFNGKI